MKRRVELSSYSWVSGIGWAKRLRQEEAEEDDVVISYERPQLEVILKSSPQNQSNVRLPPIPYEILVKIFRYVVEFSDHPLRDLCSLAQVHESWRQIVLGTPTLWFRIDLTKIPITDRNIRALARIFAANTAIIDQVREVSLSGSIDSKAAKTLDFIQSLFSAVNLNVLRLDNVKQSNRATTLNQVTKSISHCENLRSISITNSKILFNQEAKLKWLADLLMERGKSLEELDLAMSIRSVSSTLMRSLGSEFCPNLRLLDLSTCDALNTHSFDAKLLAQTAPNLEILRLANLSFKRVYAPPEEFRYLTKLRELSMPIGMRDADRDDALFATLTFGSTSMTMLDLRGSTISTNALLELPSYDVRELHMDDLCPILRPAYHDVIEKWRDSLEKLSLVKINCSATIKRCLEALSKPSDPNAQSKLQVLDLSSSDVSAADLRNFLEKADNLSSINLSSCRSLPRGCKGSFARQSKDRSIQKLSELKKRLR